METHGLSLEQIADAAAFLEGRIRRTPIEPCPVLSEAWDVPVHLKLENLQVTGSFKIRGAFFKLSRLSDQERTNGIAVCSAGNHGKAVAFAAREMGLQATVYVPSNVDASKHQAIVDLGAEVVVSPHPGYDDTQALALEKARESGRRYISPFDDWEIMAANGGTLASECLEQAPDSRVFLVPVGGGGLAAGFSFHVKQTAEQSRLVGCQLAASPGLALSLDKGHAVTHLPYVETDAKGLEGGVGKLTFEVMQSRIDEVALVSEEEIGHAFRWILEKHHYLIEPSAAATLAACINGKIKPPIRPVLIVLSGRNVDSPTIRRLVAG